VPQVPQVFPVPLEDGVAIVALKPGPASLILVTYGGVAVSGPAVDIWKKLNYKAQDPVLVVNAPGSFKVELAELAGLGAGIHASPEVGVGYGFILAFAKDAVELDKVADICLLCMAEGAVLWFGFPKQSSRTIKSDINRDKLADLLALRHLQPNRNVAIDEDWSALRFRRA
jgi:hypothetical protein